MGWPLLKNWLIVFSHSGPPPALKLTKVIGNNKEPLPKPLHPNKAVRQPRKVDSARQVEQTKKHLNKEDDKAKKHIDEVRQWHENRAKQQQ